MHEQSKGLEMMVEFFKILDGGFEIQFARFRRRGKCSNQDPDQASSRFSSPPIKFEGF